MTARAVIDGRFELRGPLGKGSAAEVLLAHDRARGDACCIKRIGLGRDDVVDRFVAEIATLTAIDCAHIVPVRAYGADDDGVWYAMDLMAGSLADKSPRGEPLDPLRVTRWMIHALVGLESLHRRGIVHRDVKPGNLLYDREGYIKVADLGLARHADGSVNFRTRPDVGMGTPSFAAPEIIRDAHSADHRADLYGIGVTFFALTSGQSADRFVLHTMEPSILDDAPEAFVPALKQLGASKPEGRPENARAAVSLLCDAADHYAMAHDRERRGAFWMTLFDRLMPPLGLQAWVRSKLWHLGLR